MSASLLSLAAAALLLFPSTAALGDPGMGVPFQDLESQIEALEEQVEEATGGIQDQIDDEIDPRLDALESLVATLQGQIATLQGQVGSLQRLEEDHGHLYGAGLYAGVAGRDREIRPIDVTRCTA